MSSCSTMPACDRPTDGQTLNDSMYRTSIASRGKNLLHSENKGRRVCPLDPRMI